MEFFILWEHTEGVGDSFDGFMIILGKKILTVSRILCHYVKKIMTYLDADLSTSEDDLLLFQLSIDKIMSTQ